MPLFCAAMTVCLLAVLQAPANGYQGATRLRFDNERIREVLVWTSDRSPSFWRLVAAIEASDVVVYLGEGRCAAGEVPAYVHVLPDAGGRKLVVHVNPRLPLVTVVRQLAHELQHAVEIAGDPAARDQTSVRKLYERIGFANCPETVHECWETNAAQSAEAAILNEAQTMRPQPAAAPDASYFGTWRLNVARSTFNGAPPPRESTRIVADRRCGLISTVVRTVDLDGRVDDQSFVLRLDRRPYPMPPRADRAMVTIAETAIDRFTARFVIEDAGGVVATGNWRITDGTEMTIETHLVDAYGQEVIEVTVWEKVG